MSTDNEVQTKPERQKAPKQPRKRRNYADECRRLEQRIDTAIRLLEKIIANPGSESAMQILEVVLETLAEKE